MKTVGVGEKEQMGESRAALLNMMYGGDEHRAKCVTKSSDGRNGVRHTPAKMVSTTLRRYPFE